MKYIIKFLSAVIEIIVDCTIFILEQCLELVGFLFKKQEVSKPAYDAKFEDDIGMTLSSWNKGFVLNGTAAISRELSTHNMYLSGVSGTGKSSVIIIPNIIHLASQPIKEAATIFVNDPSGEIASKCVPYLTSRGYRIHCINLGNVSASDGLNVLLLTDRKPGLLQKIATLIVTLSMGNNTGDPFWSLASINLLTITLRILSYQPDSYFTLSSARSFLMLMGAEPKTCDLAVIRTKDAELYTAYKSYLSISEKTRQSILATTLASLEFASNPDVATITSQTTIDIISLRSHKQPTALFIQSPSLDVQHNRIVLSLIFNSLFQHILKKLPDKSDRYIFTILDEIGSIKLDNLAEVLLVQRKYRCASLIASQDFNVLQNNYGKMAASIIANCSTKVFLGNMPLEQALMVEKMLGSTEWQDGLTTKIRPLMTANQLQQLPTDKAIAFMPGKRPLLLKMTPYYKSSMRAKTNMPSVERKGTLSFDFPMITKDYLDAYYPGTI